MKLQLRSAALALAAVPLVFLASGCTPECIDLFDCAEQARKSGQAMTCVASKCTPATIIDAGAGGGGGETGGGAGGGGGDEDAGIDAGTGGGTASQTANFIATLNAAQATGSTSTSTGTATFVITDETDGGYTFEWNITHTIADAGVSGEFAFGLAGFNGTSWFTLTNADSPVTGTRSISSAQAVDIASGLAFVALDRGNAEIRGQIIPEGNALWTARLDTPTPGPTFGGVQFIAPLDGGAVWYAGAWTSDVEATLAHIHQGGAGGTGNPIVTLAIFDGGLAGSFPLVDLTTGDTDGGLYVNVHTADAGDGLIRGQLIQH